MGSLWQTLGTFLVGIGGVSGVIIFLSKWLAQLIADRIIQSKQQQFDRELAGIRANFDLALEQYRTKASEYIYVSQIQFEAEFKTYQLLFENLYQFGICTSDLYPTLDFVSSDTEKAKADYTERYKRYVQAYNEFSSVLEKNAPFIPKHLYDLFVALRQQAREISCMYPEIKIVKDPLFEEDDKQVEQDNFKLARAFRKDIATIKTSVRDHLATLRIQN